MDFRNILFYKPGAIGDFLHTLPSLKALRKQFPAAHITVVLSRGQEQMIRGTPLADRVVVFDKAFLKERFGNFLNFALVLRRERYDLFVDMEASPRSFLARLLSGAGRTLVYCKQKQAPRDGKRLHAVENFLATLAPLGIRDAEGRIELPVRPDAARAVERFLDAQGVRKDALLIALNCGAGAARPARNWYPERFAELGDRLIAELGAAVVFVGGREDRDLVAGVLARMDRKGVSAAGELSLPETAALLARSRCVVSSDTGPLHLATAVGTPVVGLYGSTEPRRTGPFGSGHTVVRKELSCAPCEEKECPQGTRACMDQITVDEVFDSVRKTLLCGSL